MQILIVEDDARISRQTTAALTEAGHDCVAVPDGEAALARMLLREFDLVVLDVGLPGIDGFDVVCVNFASDTPRAGS